MDIAKSAGMDLALHTIAKKRHSTVAHLQITVIRSGKSIRAKYLVGIQKCTFKLPTPAHQLSDSEVAILLIGARAPLALSQHPKRTGRLDLGNSACPNITNAVSNIYIKLFPSYWIRFRLPAQMFGIQHKLNCEFVTYAKFNFNPSRFKNIHCSRP